jgi:cytoskeletal protein CcmA (bactofilin family)
MFKEPKENFQEEAETIVGASVNLEGNFSSKGSVTINGTVNGKVTTEKNLNVGSEANVKADLEGENVTIAGRVEGNVKAREKLEIQALGKVYGDVSAKTLSIVEGAIFSGQSKMGERAEEAKTE